MATITAILNKKYKSKDGTYPIAIRISDGNKQPPPHPIGYKIQEKYWMDGQVSDKHPDADIINSIIDDELLKAKRYYADCKIKGVPADPTLAFSKVKSHNFTDYLRHRAIQHKEADQIEMEFKANRYVKELTACFGRDIYFSELTQDLLRRFDTWLKKGDENRKSNIANTRAKKFEFLGKYYTNAVSEGKAYDPNPFRLYKIKTTQVKKEKLSIEQLQAIEKLSLQDGPVKFARDLFLFSYYCKGARFETCITMQKKSVSAGRLTFQANKGLKFLSVPLHDKLAGIINHYSENETEYIFDRIKTPLAELIKDKKKKRSVIGSENTQVNRNLKVVAALAEIDIPLSMHHARHSLAFHLKQTSANIGAISDILGHSGIRVTEVYLKTLDDTHLDAVLNNVYK